MSRTQKFALVTGCGQGGIGEALVTEYARRGIHPIATVLPNESSEHLSAKGITFFPLDVTVEESVVELKARIRELTGGYLDILVNCAGIAYTMTAIDTDVGAVQRMFDVNLFGPMRMVHHFHDLIIPAKGTIVNIGSIGGIVPYLYGASYNATKAGLHHWSNTLRVEMAPFDVRVITVISGEVYTNILKNDAHRQLPEGSYYSPLAEEFRQHVTRTPSGATDRFQYASKVVGESLRSSPAAWFWTGSSTGLIRCLDTFAWRTIWDWMFWRMFNLGKLHRSHAGLGKKQV
ncbi:NAD(P)-binding protein [Aspergillus japonicus CBS 114.51]|uniref:NAD(P)-binding protein n=2 Tax=Aspergillus TaxID=5052 RepID=A0A2V5HX56_ASPV1|nr:NAD(P)-binding protein [Aspergillus japonicus CBS 114.51]PYI20860.1 NAD(P)-binding protein [Aspergillus violaceofuscus CBS 115571]RAH78915.1 NAD(P)-binding protein [Aspergillus japonicus CBS 114.51]